MTETERKPNETKTVAICRVLVFKRWLFTMRNMACHAAFRDLLEKRLFMAGLGFSLTTLLEAVFFGGGEMNVAE